MSIPGYDAWRLAGPPEWEGPSCDWCDGIEDVRVQTEGCGCVPPVLTCEECFTGTDTGPCFDDLQTAEEYYGEQEAERADYLHDQARDRRGEEE